VPSCCRIEPYVFSVGAEAFACQPDDFQESECNCFALQLQRESPIWRIYMYDSILTACLGIAVVSGAALAASNPVKIEKSKYSTYGNVYKMSNETVELLVTLDMGPRIIFYGFSGGENNLAELGPDSVVHSELGDWHPWGGHRLWHAPESIPRSYVPDDGPVDSEIIGNSTIRVAPPLEAATHI